MDLIAALASFQDPQDVGQVASLEHALAARDPISFAPAEVAA